LNSEKLEEEDVDEGTTHSRKQEKPPDEHVQCAISKGITYEWTMPRSDRDYNLSHCCETHFRAIHEKYCQVIDRPHGEESPTVA